MARSDFERTLDDIVMADLIWCKANGEPAPAKRSAADTASIMWSQNPRLVAYSPSAIALSYQRVIAKRPDLVE
jgi:hypothetical protein